MKSKQLWLLSLLGGWVGLVGLAIAKAQDYPSQVSSTPSAIAGVDLSQWPKECRQLRRELNHPSHSPISRKARRGYSPSSRSTSSNQVTYEARPIQPFATPAWKFRWQGTTLALPAADYRQLTVVRQVSGLVTLALQAGDSNDIRMNDIRVVLSQLPEERPDLDVRDAIANLDGIELLPLRGRRQQQVEKLLAQQLFQGAPTQQDLVELAYQHQPDHLSCKLENWQQDIPIALALDLKQEQLSNIVAVYPQVGQTEGRVVRRLTLAQPTPEQNELQSAPPFLTEWQAQISFEGKRSEAWVSLPEEHVSSNIGLAFGQENWWEAENRPAWLDLLEQAIPSRQPQDWQTLAHALEAAQFSADSVRSVRYLAAELSSIHEVRTNLSDAPIHSTTAN